MLACMRACAHACVARVEVSGMAAAIDDYVRFGGRVVDCGQSCHVCAEMSSVAQSCRVRRRVVGVCRDGVSWDVVGRDGVVSRDGVSRDGVSRDVFWDVDSGCRRQKVA